MKEISRRLDLRWLAGGMLAMGLGFGLSACDFPVYQAPGTGGQNAVTLDPADREALVSAFQEFLTAQQARQQVNVTNGTLIADNSAGLISNNGASLVKNAPLIADNSAGLVSNNGNGYRLSATSERKPSEHHGMPDGTHYYRIGNPANLDTLVETFVTRTPNTSLTGFEVPDEDVVMHARMKAEFGDPFEEDPVTNRYAIEVLKSPVFTDFKSDIAITAPALGKTQLYVEKATYVSNGLPVVAEATHSAFASFGGPDLPTSGEERIRIGETLLSLKYQNVSGKGVGDGSWTGASGEAWPLTYTFDFSRNQAEMQVSMPEERKLRLTLKPGLQVVAGSAVDRSGEPLAKLGKRPDGTIVLRFSESDEAVLFE